MGYGDGIRVRDPKVKRLVADLVHRHAVDLILATAALAAGLFELGDRLSR